jgi:hypothetical protein
MRRSLSLTLLGLPLMLALACSGGGNSEAPVAVTATTPSANTVVFDPTTGAVPLPNVLASAMAANPLTGAWTNPNTGVTTPGARPAGVPMTPPEALAYINLYEMGGTNAVSGVNAPIYLRFAAPVVASTVTAANIKVFQLTPDAAGTENNALGFADVSGMFRYQYTAGGTDLFLFPNFPMLPATRYLYVVTNRVQDVATGGAVSATPYFEALKSTVPLTGSLQGLEAIRDDARLNQAQPKGPTNPILLSGYAKVMDDAIAAAATTTITKRADISVLGRFITGVSAISRTHAGPSATDPTTIPTESALRAFAAGTPLGGFPGTTWTYTPTVTSSPTPAAYWTTAFTAIGLPVTTPPASVGTVTLGSIDSASICIDPVVARAHAATIDLTAVAGPTGPYNVGTGVLQGYRPDTVNLTGFYFVRRPVNFVYITPTGTAPAGGWPLVIFAHGLGCQKEYIVGMAGTLTAAGKAVIAIDLPLHGDLRIPGHNVTDQWSQDFMALGAPLATRSNVQQAAFDLNRLELDIRAGGFAALGPLAPSGGPTGDIKFLGDSLGSIVGAYYLASNTTLSTTGLPYTQATLNNDMKGYLSVPGGRLAYLLQNSPHYSPAINAGLAAIGIATNSPTYHQFWQVTQSVTDTIDPASVTTPLATGLPSRLSGRIAIQESTSTTFSASVSSDGLPIPTNGDLYIGNPYTRYFANALGGREVLGAAGAAVAPGFKQLAYTAGGTPNHAAGTPAQFLFTITGGAMAPKAANAATSASAITPTEGYFQMDQSDTAHTSIYDYVSRPITYGLIQKQMRYFLANGAVVDPTQVP